MASPSSAQQPLAYPRGRTRSSTVSQSSAPLSHFEQRLFQNHAEKCQFLGDIGRISRMNIADAKILIDLFRCRDTSFIGSIETSMLAYHGQNKDQLTSFIVLFALLKVFGVENFIKSDSSFQATRHLSLEACLSPMPRLSLENTLGAVSRKLDLNKITAMLHLLFGKESPETLTNMIAVAEKLVFKSNPDSLVFDICYEDQSIAPNIVFGEPLSSNERASLFVRS